MIEEQKKDENNAEKKLVESKLESTLQHLLRLICDVRAMEETLMELEYDATKAPLGMCSSFYFCSFILNISFGIYGRLIISSFLFT